MTQFDKWLQIVPDAESLIFESCTDYCEYGGTFDLVALIERKNGDLLNVRGCWDGVNKYFHTEWAVVVTGWELWHLYGALGLC